MIPLARPARRPPRRRRLGATVGAALLSLVLLVAPTTASAAPAPTPTPTPTASTPTASTPIAEPGDVDVTLSPLAAGILRPGERLAVSVTLTNGTDAPTPTLPVRLWLGGAALPDRSALSAWLEGEGALDGLDEVAATEIESVPAGGERTGGISVEADDPRLAGREPGVYPLAASYDLDGETVTAVSVVVIPEDGAETTLGVVVPVTAPAMSAGLLTATELAALTAPTGALTSQLDGVEGTPAILAVDPAIPAAIRVLGSRAPASATEWLERLLALPNSRFALQFGDADVEVQLAAGLERPLRPLGLSAFLTPQDFVPVAPTPGTTPTPAATPTPTPTATAVPGEPVLPDTEQLLDIGGGRDAVFWPAPGTTSPGSVAQLGGIEIDGQSSVTLLPSAATTAGADGGTVPARGDAEGAAVLVYDSAVSDALHEASLREEGSLRGAPLAAASAYLSFAVAETPGLPVMVTLDREPERSRVALRAALTAATQYPGATAVTLGALASSPAVTITPVDGAPTAERVDAASALIADEDALGRFATILDQPSLLTGPERTEVLQLLSVAWVDQPDAAARAVQLHRGATRTTLGSVELLPTSTINLFGSGAGLRFWVRNDLQWPVNLVLYAAPGDLRLDVQRATPVVASPQSNTRVEVPVQARVGSGDVVIDLQLRSPASIAIGDSERVEVSVRAEWEGVGITALAVLVGSLFVLGVVRTVLKLRARRRGTPASP
ncbi:DUF6049 family protein [Microbacterium chocolatum]|uniref:DUF6049 family protein n=1 Tax=Microbacterium aurantiacum TaxID=162393 RepID=UPI00338E86FC